MKFTTEQLKQNADAMIAFADNLPVQMQSAKSGEWFDYNPDNNDFTGFAVWPCRRKPVPKTRPWAKPDDVPLNCWLTVLGCETTLFVTCIDEKGVYNISVLISWSNLGTHGYLYSTDRKTWKKCETEE